MIASSLAFFRPFPANNSPLYRLAARNPKNVQSLTPSALLIRTSLVWACPTDGAGDWLALHAARANIIAEAANLAEKDVKIVMEIPSISNSNL
ncbi:hypothetical protein [Tateyamaria sp.]|uniref:hypothetical protein n=1 Tax=Tateyamaria sp. TaxID=1929288 RepID=UPI0032716A28